MNSYLEWYQNTLRPCVKQYVRFTFARYKADRKWEIRSYVSEDPKDEVSNNRGVSEMSSTYQSADLVTGDDFETASR